MTLQLHVYLDKVAKTAFDKYGDDYYEALNAAECIVRDCEEGNIEHYAQRVHAVLEGEI